jgi:Flp pilus assembly protein protease CpaA
MTLILLVSLYISLFDLRHHRITNLSVLLISTLLFINGDFHIYFLTGILFLGPLLLLAIFGGLGGGDVKLLMAVALLAIPVASITTYLTILVLAISILTALTIAARMRLRGNIALGPAICASYLAFLFTQ